MKNKMTKYVIQILFGGLVIVATACYPSEELNVDVKDSDVVLESDFRHLHRRKFYEGIWDGHSLQIC